MAHWEDVSYAARIHNTASPSPHVFYMLGSVRSVTACLSPRVAECSRRRAGVGGAVSTCVPNIFTMFPHINMGCACSRPLSR